jgi:hypothetical protein
MQKGLAECIYAENFSVDKEDLDFKIKLYHFNRLLCQNEQSESNMLHVFLNFGFGERLTNDKMAIVAKEYMEGMGFGGQPYLVYRHHDTHHIHAHIVSTFIRSNGKRIGIPLADFYRSKKLTYQIEHDYSLLLSDPASREEKLRQTPLQKIKYGEGPLLMAMSKVLEAVLPVYKFTNLSELNAVLRLYDMEASRGREGSRIWNNRGLIFRPVIERGRDESLYIKASVFKGRPTLANLEKKFALNETLRQPHRSRLTTAIDWALYKKSLDITTFRMTLQKESITTVLQKDKTGQLMKIWYVDRHTNSVFEGAALGNRYSAEGIRQRCVPDEAYRQQLELKQQQELVQRHRLRLNQLDSL